MKSLLALAAVASAASICGAQTWNFNIDGLQSAPPNASPGFGTGTVTYNAGTNSIDWNISWTGLLAAPTAMHFHQAAAGTNGPVIVPIGSWTGGTTGGTIGSAGGLSPGFVAALIAGDVYFNLHTPIFPGGEIRGQVVPTPAAGALLGLGVLAAGRRRR